MSYEPYQQKSAVGTDTFVDAGLQEYMRGVFNTMSVGLGVTGIVAWIVANTPLANVVFSSQLVAMAFMFAPLVFLMFGFTQGRIMRSSPASLKRTFFIFAAVMGVSFASVLMVFSGESIARAFFITAGTFAAMAIWGYTTKRDLTSMGSFLYMGLIGLVLASIVNVFLASSAVHFAVSIIGVFVFTGLTAYDVQRLKEVYRVGGGAANDKAAIMGALSLYLSFINLFQIIIQFMGSRD